MNTIQLQNNISVEQYQMAVRVLNAIGIKTKKVSLKKEKKDDTKMTKEEFFKKIDRASKQQPIRMTLEEMNAYLDKKIAEI